MFNNIGKWENGESYDTYPKEEWCDLDYVANYIEEQKYIPIVSMDNLVWKLIRHFESETEDDNSLFLPLCNKDLMINIEMLSAFVEASGGLKEFDYEGSDRDH